MQSITTNNKRGMKQGQRPRKKPVPHHSKMSSQIIEGGDKGTNYNPSASYTFVRYFVGNVVEVHTSTHVSVGVVKAISPSGDVGLISVHTVPIGTEDGPYTIEKHRYIPLSAIKHVVARDVKIIDALKDAVHVEESSQANDSDGELQKFYESPGEEDACSLGSQEGFPVEQMFKINKEKYNVVSTFKENLEGYTCPLDKNDPDFKKKEQFYAQVAKEMEEDKNLASNWESMAEGDVECEEVKYSAVMKEGVQGRELKNTYRNNRSNKGGRGNSRASLPRETTESNKPSVRPNAFTLPREQSKSIAESNASKSEKPTPKVSRVTTPAATETSEAVDLKEKCESESSPLNRNFDPDAPVFEPSRPITAESTCNSPVSNAAAGPAQPQCVVSNPGIVHPHHTNSNGVSSTLAFSALSYPNPGLLSFRPSATMNTQQVTFMNQYPFFNAGAQSQRAMRPNAPAGYSKHRSIDQANPVPLPTPFPSFGYAPYAINIPFMPPGNVPMIHPLPIPGPIPVAPNVQQSNTSQPPAATGQASQPVQSPPPVQASSAHFHPLFNQNQTPYPQYPNAAGQPIGYYPPSIPGYQTAAGLVYHPGHPHAHGHGPPQALMPQSLQLQPNASPASQQQAFNNYQAVAAMAAALTQQQQQQNAPTPAAFMHPQQLQQLQYLTQQQQANNPG